jgi:hypothetical protein
LKIKTKIKGINVTPSLKDEQVPTLDELKGIFPSGDTKAKIGQFFQVKSRQLFTPK